MDALIIEKTTDTPRIVLDPLKNLYEITDRSLPEDANGFYAPVFQWLTSFLDKPENKIQFSFCLEYFNTASAKQIAKVLLFF